MDPVRLINSLDRFASVLPAAVAGIPPDDARWKPADGAWSILEVVGHLLDEEVRDFRTRLRLVLEDPSRPWPPIEPERWAVAERYTERDLPQVTRQWVIERQASLRRLRSLGDVDWSKGHQHPGAGLQRAGDLLTSWAAHDALRLRQIAKRLHQLAQRNGATYSARYAGEWRA